MSELPLYSTEARRRHNNNNNNSNDPSNCGGTSTFRLNQQQQNLSFFNPQQQNGGNYAAQPAASSSFNNLSSLIAPAASNIWNVAQHRIHLEFPRQHLKTLPLIIIYRCQWKCHFVIEPLNSEQWQSLARFAISIMD
uniref:Uncharacterized protein n=1 Tax=Globodera pallida TaxID=36090 RepID=A0A183BTK2_GLOPA